MPARLLADPRLRANPRAWASPRTLANPRTYIPGFLPTDIAGLLLWVAADRGLSLSDGGAVGTWPDQSGNGNDLTQASAGLRPTFQTNEINGQPIIRFDGADDHLLMPMALQDAKTIFIVAQLSAIPSAEFFTLLRIKFDASTFSELLFADDASYENVVVRHDFQAGGGSVGVSPALDTSPHIWTHTYDNGDNTLVASYTLRIDGAAQTLVTDNNVGATGTDKGSIGARVDTSDAGTLQAAIDWAELAIYDSVLPAANLSTLDTYASDKYGISI